METLRVALEGEESILVDDLLWSTTDKLVVYGIVSLPRSIIVVAFRLPRYLVRHVTYRYS